MLGVRKECDRASMLPPEEFMMPEFLSEPNVKALFVCLVVGVGSWLLNSPE